MNLSKYNYKHDELKSLKELEVNATYPVQGFKFAKSTYGEFVILYSNDFDIALPGRMVDTFKRIQQNPEDLAEINSGRYGINIVEFKYDNFYGKGTSRGIEFVKLPL